MKRAQRLAEMSIELCRHEIERLRAQHSVDTAEIRRLHSQVRRLEQKLARRQGPAR